MENKELFDAIKDSAVVLDRSGRIINWNSGAKSLFGYSKREVLGRSINLIYKGTYPFQKIIQEVNGTNDVWHAETEFVHKNGDKGICRSQLAILPKKNDSKLRAILLHHDTTPYKELEYQLEETKQTTTEQLEMSLAGFWGATELLVETINNLEQTERRLRESELRFHLLAENATDVISRHSPDGTFLYASPAAELASGFQPDELIGKNIYKLIHHDDHGKIKKSFTRKRGHNLNRRPVVYRLKRKEGEYRWFESNIRLIIDPQTKIISEVQLASRDVTDRILDKKARLRGQQLAHVFRLSTMEEMASGMAHEISQPLGAIVNYTSGCVRHLENNDYDTEQLKQIMEKAVNQAKRAGEIIQRLKNFFCKGQLVKTPCKINNVIRETASLMKNELTQSKTKIETELDKKLPFIFIDKIQIQQVLLNLMQNAIEAMQENNIKVKRIHIQTIATGKDMIEVTIRDSGPGFSKELINKVFMPFFTTKAHGRGMGLAICRSIIEAHGGEFTINPSKGDDGWIRFSLPISI